jgi:hexosaminidase
MLDTARRFYSLQSILQMLDAMHIAKFNVFHWHLVEDESFPLELKIFQNAAKNGAFKKGETYTRDMVKQIVDHAQRLAIRVVPEFDNPGHSRAIGLDPYFTEIVRCFNKTDQYNLTNAYRI